MSLLARSKEKQLYSQAKQRLITIEDSLAYFIFLKRTEKKELIWKPINSKISKPYFYLTRSVQPQNYFLVLRGWCCLFQNTSPRFRDNLLCNISLLPHHISIQGNEPPSADKRCQNRPIIGLGCTRIWYTGTSFVKSTSGVPSLSPVTHPLAFFTECIQNMDAGSMDHPCDGPGSKDQSPFSDPVRSPVQGHCRVRSNYVPYACSTININTFFFPRNFKRWRGRVDFVLGEGKRALSFYSGVIIIIFSKS